MSYIGASPIVGNFQVCDAISVVNGQAAYTMQVGGSNVLPESANHMLVSLNGILQKPNGSFTISGSTITFSSNLVTGDVIDFIQLLGDVLDIGTPSDATVTNAKTSFVSTSSAAGLQIKGDGTTDGTLQLNCSQNSHGIKLASPAHSAGQSYTVKFPTGNITADKFLKVASISGSGTSAVGQLSFADAGGGIEEADQWRLNTTLTSVTDQFITANLERVDNTGWEKLGTGMSESSGVFTFPSTGIYLVSYTILAYSSTTDGFVDNEIHVTTDNSSYNAFARGYAGFTANASNSATAQTLIDVTNTSNVKVKFYINSLNSTTNIYGATDRTGTGFTFIKLGDT